jgi:uncharacterized protein YijF (DUF1287 family)
MFASLLVSAWLAAKTVPAFVQRWQAAYHGAPVKRDAAFSHALSDAALARTRAVVRYEAAYVPISYPNGDVPADTGVCSDEVIRSYRALGVDLQQDVHRDMAAAFEAYPKLWGLARPDPNIDHRRVPNLMTFFSRHGATLPVTGDPRDYAPGDLVVWVLSNGLLHIGVVVEPRSADGLRPLIVHNIGEGPKLEDAFDVGTRVAHFRYEKP